MKKPKRPDVPRFTLSAFARLVDASREAVRVRVHRADVQSAGTISGNPTYHAADLIRAWLAPRTVSVDDMTPFELAAHYQAELKKMTLSRMRAEVVPRAQVVECSARIAQIVVDDLAALPDRLRRECGLTAQQVALVRSHMAVALDQVQKTFNDGALAVAS